jgi:hypothetical protein
MVSTASFHQGILLLMDIFRLVIRNGEWRIG